MPRKIFTSAPSTVENVTGDVRYLGITARLHTTKEVRETAPSDTTRPHTFLTDDAHIPTLTVGQILDFSRNIVSRRPVGTPPTKPGGLTSKAGKLLTERSILYAWHYEKFITVTSVYIYGIYPTGNHTHSIECTGCKDRPNDTSISSSSFSTATIPHVVGSHPKS